MSLYITDIEQQTGKTNSGPMRSVEWRPVICPGFRVVALCQKEKEVSATQVKIILIIVLYINYAQNKSNQ